MLEEPVHGQFYIIYRHNVKVGPGGQCEDKQEIDIIHSTSKQIWSVIVADCSYIQEAKNVADLFASLFVRMFIGLYENYCWSLYWCLHDVSSSLPEIDKVVAHSGEDEMNTFFLVGWRVALKKVIQRYYNHSSLLRNWLTMSRKTVFDSRFFPRLLETKDGTWKGHACYDVRNEMDQDLFSKEVFKNALDTVRLNVQLLYGKGSVNHLPFTNSPFPLCLNFRN